MFQRDARNTGYSPSKTPNPGNQIWNKTFETSINSAPAVADGKIYVGTQSTLYCLDSKTGEQIWKFNAPHPEESYYHNITPESPAVYNGKVYFGTQIWFLTPVDEIPLNYVSIHCCDADTGEYLWNYTTIGCLEARPYSSPTIVDGILYAGDGNDHTLGGEILSLDAETGAVIRNDSGFWFLTAPVIHEGKIFANSFGGWDGLICRAFCFNASSGNKIWSNLWSDNYNSRWVMTHVSLAYDRLYVGSFDLFMCFNSSNGERLWNYTNGPTYGASPAIHSSKVYIQGHEKTICLNAFSGAFIWSYPNKGHYTPVLADGKVFLGSTVLDANTGKYLYEYPVNGEYTIIADRRVYITSENTLYCYGDQVPHFVIPESLNGTIGIVTALLMSILIISRKQIKTL